MKNFSKKYLEVLTTELAGLNLTRITDPDEFYNKQVMDSVKPYEECESFQSNVNEAKLLVDVGTGGGFPLLPLAYHLPEINFLGIDSKSKKVEAIKKIYNYMELSNVNAVHERIENILFDRKCVITFKAVGTVFDCLNNLNIKEDVTVYFYKGPNFYEKENQKRLPTGWRLIEEMKVVIPGTEGRLLLGYAFRNVPRGTKDKGKKSKKSLVKLSKLI